MKSVRRFESPAVVLSPRERDYFVYTVLSRATLPQERTVFTDLIVDLFLDHYSKAIQNSSAELLAWIERSCTQYPDKPLPQIFAAACTESAEAFDHEKGRSAFADAVLALNGEILSVIMKPRLLPQYAVEPLSEMDVAADRWVQALEKADRVTAEHSRAVGAWCSRLGRALSLDAKEVAHLGRCGLLHDVGKLQTPEHILGAPRELDDSEWHIMKRHAIEGESMLAADPVLGHLAPAARSHHERFDGSGYPDQLAGHDIPMAARVVSVADSFNAMIARRPYRTPITPTLAMEELERMSGTQFDPTIVAAMREVVTIS